MRHFIIVGILVIAAAVLTYTGLNAIGMLPVEASAQAIPIDWMWNLQVIAISFLFALIVVPLVYSLIVFRRRKGDNTDAKHIEGNTTLEVAWTIVPLIVVVMFAYFGAYSLGETRRVDPNAMVVKVTGFQWGWQFEYPEYGFTSNTLYLPADKQVLLQLQAVDVIHSFWVPEFRVKQDLVPGRITEIRVTPILLGEYKVRCAEICGTEHAYMESPVQVVEASAFDQWVEEQKLAAAEAEANATPEQRGQKLYATYCKACHSIDGSAGNGPTWSGLFGHEVELADGSTVTADEAYLAQSIKEPQSQVVKGFAPMAFNATAVGIGDAEIQYIIAYIKTLK
ncbi:MAG: cytochrome c oxidase subunit II [Chloroflexota bacterium]